MIRLVLIALLLGPQLAAAAPAAGAVSTWTVAGRTLTLRYTFPTALAARLVPAGAALPPVEKISQYLLSQVSVQQQGRPCASIDQGYDLGRADALYAGPGLTSFEILFRCPADTGALVLRNDAFFELAPDQIGIAALRVNGSAEVTRVLTRSNPAIAVSATSGLTSNLPATYIGLGMRHASGAALCLGAALGLALLVRDRRGLARAAGALGLGYLVASIAAAAGGLLLEPQAAQAAGGALIALLAAQLTARISNRPGLTAVGLSAAAAIAAIVALLQGQGEAALALFGTGIFGAAVLGLPKDSGFGEVRVLVPAAIIGVIDGFALATRFAPLRSLYAPGTGSLLAYNLGALLSLALLLTAAAGIRSRLQLRVFTHSALGHDLLVALLAGVGTWSMLALS